MKRQDAFCLPRKTMVLTEGTVILRRFVSKPREGFKRQKLCISFESYSEALVFDLPKMDVKFMPHDFLPGRIPLGQCCSCLLVTQTGAIRNKASCGWQRLWQGQKIVLNYWSIEPWSVCNQPNVDYEPKTTGSLDFRCSFLGAFHCMPNMMASYHRVNKSGWLEIHITIIYIYNTIWIELCLFYI